MSKINAVRLINLNYNNNAIRISDETFQFGGDSTLMSLRNGGGKSVLVQMMTAPFVHKQYRKAPDRPFESYFTTAKPTFIMVEWKLDQDAGYCLTGMMVRRSQASEEQSSEPLEIVQFISEYPSRCEQDIYHIPVVEKTNKEVVLKSFQACKQLFETYKKDPSMKFFYYDMNNYAQSRQYFEKLAEYKIYYKEWESIIRKVNEKESGLSELFSDCKNEKDLVDKWFLKTIESKLNREQNRMKEFQSIIEKYVQIYKDNQSKIARRDTILQFKDDMLVVEEKAQQYQQTEMQVKSLENRIACFRKELNSMEETVSNLLKDIEEQSASCDERISHILYEKMSMEMHELLDQLAFHYSNRDSIEQEMEVLETEIAQVDRIIHLHNCAKQQMVVDECTNEYEVLTQKMEVSRKNEQELEPERIRIGGCLKLHYQMVLEEILNMQKAVNETYNETSKQCQEQKEQAGKWQKQMEDLIAQIAMLRTKVDGFTQKEAEFNRTYEETLERNILGDYEPGMLAIKKEQYDKELELKRRECNQQLRQQEEMQERKRTCERDREDKIGMKKNAEFDLLVLQENEKNYEEQRKERQMIMRYLQAEDDWLWQQEKLLELAQRKLSEIDQNRRSLEQEEHTLKQDWKKLTSGEILELPQDFKELLQELELHPVYGMNWMEKNGYTVEENKELVRRQPFLPYSLILPKAEIHKLETKGREIYTSFPIPLIPRERLDEALTMQESSVLNMQGISFYLWFNENLLDEEALRMLIAEKEAEIKKKQEQIALRQTEYQDYMDKKSILMNQTITKELVEQNRIEQAECKEKIAGLEEEITTLSDEMKKLSETLDLLSKTIFDGKQMIARYERREADYAQFMNHYDVYQKQRQEIGNCENEKKHCEEMKQQAITMQEQYEQKLKTLEYEKQEILGKETKCREKQVRYATYETPDVLPSEQTPQEIEARYEAITTKMSADLQELEQQQVKAGKNLMNARRELTKLCQKYGFSASAGKFPEYNEKEQLHQEVILEDKQKKYKVKEKLCNEEKTQIAVLSSKMEDKKKAMQEQCGMAEPLAKNEIHTIDFDAEMNQLKYQKKELAKERKLQEGKQQSYNEHLTAFAEYQDFVVEDLVEWEEEPALMDTKRLREFAGVMRRDYRETTREQSRQKERLEAHLNILVRKEMYQDDYYRKPLEAMLSVTESAKLVISQLATTIQSYDSQMAKLEVDIALVKKEKDKIEGNLEDYIKDVHSDMAKIDNNSTITIRERSIKMLRIKIPDWEENEGLYRQRLSDFIDELTKQAIAIYEKNENPANYFSSHITTKNIYDTIVGIGNIQIKLYKIEEQREYQITWAEVAKNSGGEGFVSAFVILSSLLQYMRRDETDIFADRNEGKVLVMDNPFAQTNAAHLLKPLMDMAKKTNTQLICLSGLGGESIYSRFDNIYVLNLVSASLRGGMQYLRGEHTRGAEEEIVVPSQIAVYEQQSLLF